MIQPLSYTVPSYDINQIRACCSEILGKLDIIRSHCKATSELDDIKFATMTILELIKPQDEIFSEEWCALAVELGYEFQALSRGEINGLYSCQKEYYKRQ